MNKRLLYRSKKLDLTDAVRLYIVYLNALGLRRTSRLAQTRVLRHILEFYGPRFPLTSLDGRRILQYADLYDPYDDDRVINEYGRFFWKFVHWMKKNQMIPAWTDPENG